MNVNKYYGHSGQTGFMRSLDCAPRLERIFTEDLLKAKDRQFAVGIAGCSTGQEVWSYALLCASHGFSDFRVDGYDLYEQRLRVGRRGVYPGIRDSHRAIKQDRRISQELVLLRQGKDGAEIRFGEDIEERVAFYRHDFARAPFPRAYDLIIATNVLYQVQSGKKRTALLNLLNSLRQDGVLFHNDADELMSPQDRDLTDRVNHAVMRELGLRL